MPTGPNTPWKATPNKTDHLTKGFTSKVIYHYHYTTGVAVANAADVFTELNTFTNNIKGSYTLPAKYFAGDDGQGFRITMYFEKELDGNDMDIRQCIYDVTNTTLLTIASSTFTTPADNAGGTTLAKYECFITKVYTPGNATYYLQATGNITHSSKADGSTPYITPFNDYIGLTNGTNPVYQFFILNRCSANINVLNLMIEEIS
jgi:hypothetical protein